AFLSGTALTAFVAAGMFSPISVQQALAACTTATGGSPDTITCTPAPGDSDGVSLTSTDGTGVNATIAAGATLTNTTAPGATSMNVAVNGGFLSNKVFNFDMTPSNTSITG